MKIEVIKNGKKKKVFGTQVEMPEKIQFPKEIKIIAEDDDDEEVLLFMVKMNDIGGLTPTLDKIIEMIENDQLVKVDDHWEFNTQRVLTDTENNPMYG